MPVTIRQHFPVQHNPVHHNRLDKTDDELILITIKVAAYTMSLFPPASVPAAVLTCLATHLLKKWPSAGLNLLKGTQNATAIIAAVTKESEWAIAYNTFETVFQTLALCKLIKNGNRAKIPVTVAKIVNTWLTFIAITTSNTALMGGVFALHMTILLCSPVDQTFLPAYRGKILVITSYTARAAIIFVHAVNVINKAMQDNELPMTDDFIVLQSIFR